MVKTSVKVSLKELTLEQKLRFIDKIIDYYENFKEENFRMEIHSICIVFCDYCKISDGDWLRMSQDRTYDHIGGYADIVRLRFPELDNAINDKLAKQRDGYPFFRYKTPKYNVRGRLNFMKKFKFNFLKKI